MRSNWYNKLVCDKCIYQPVRQSFAFFFSIYKFFYEQHLSCYIYKFFTVRYDWISKFGLWSSDQDLSIIYLGFVYNDVLDLESRV